MHCNGGRHDKLLPGKIVWPSLNLHCKHIHDHRGYEHKQNYDLTVMLFQRILQQFHVRDEGRKNYQQHTMIRGSVYQFLRPIEYERVTSTTTCCANEQSS